MEAAQLSARYRKGSLCNSGFVHFLFAVPYFANFWIFAFDSEFSPFSRNSRSDWFLFQKNQNQKPCSVLAAGLAFLAAALARVMRVAVPIPAVTSASVFHSAAGGGSVVDVVRPL